jgi:uncharacterized LabA/DUF88 family protein
VGKNVAVFVDVANIFYAAKAAGVDIDYVTLLKTASAGRDLVRAYAYTGLDPDNENQRNFHDFLRRHGYKVVSKDIRKYGDGKVKANLDIELVVDMMKTARNLDIAIVVSGDGDFAPAIRAVQEMGVRCEVISFRGNTSSDLIEVADQFTEITQVARVEKGSSRSGRRVAGDEEDLSMTEVPDKQSEGTGGRGRGRGRGRARVAEAEPAAAPRARGRSRATSATSAASAASAPGEAIAAVTSDGTPLVVLPGEKLSRAATPAASDPVASEAADSEPTEDEDAAVASGDDDGEPVGANGEEPRRRRRRRGGRGRGRGRGHEFDEETAVGATDPGAPADPEDEAPEPAPAPAKRSGHAFGSVWDSQIGMPTSAVGGAPPLPDDEDFDEPPIPEYLIAERRQRNGGRGGPGTRTGGGRSRGAYAAALDRERYGAGHSGGGTRFAEPAPRGGRSDDRSRGGRIEDRARGDRAAPRPPARGRSGDEPWSEVPPEIEAMLRAQLGGSPGQAPRTARQRTERAVVAADAVGADAVELPAKATEPVPAQPEAPTPRRRTARTTAKAAPTESPAALPDGEGAAAEAVAVTPKRRTTRKAAAVATPGEAPADGDVEAKAPPKRRTTRKPAASPDVAAEGAPIDAAVAAPKRRTTRRKADAPES